MPTLLIDGKTVTVPQGAYLLEAARRAGAQIPTLCAHPALEPWGGCRLCVVDVARPEWSGEPKMVVSCMFPAQDGLQVDTRSERVIATRRVIVDLLLARCPNTPLVQQLAREHGLEKTSFRPASQLSDCVLCGKCTRVCDLQGISAISSASRGAGREIAAPFKQPPPDCVGCLACAEICPTSCIPAPRSGTGVTLWGAHFEMLPCTSCGKPTITAAYARFLTQRRKVPAEFFELCDACKREKLAATVASLASTA